MPPRSSSLSEVSHGLRMLSDQDGSPETKTPRQTSDAGGHSVDYFRGMFAYTACMASQDDRHRVYMVFQDRYGWHCQFLEADLKTSLPKHLHFTSSDKIIELVERAGGFKDQESRLMLDQGIAMGRGGVFLSLTDEQYRKLKC